MTVLCVNSGITYADITAADAAESGTDYGTPTLFEQSGLSASAVTFTGYTSGFEYYAKDGEETTGVLGVGAGTTGVINVFATNAKIVNLRTNKIGAKNAANFYIRNLVIEPSGSDAIEFNNTIDAENILIVDCDDGFISSVVRKSGTINKCTVIDAGRFGYAQGVFTSCVDINSSNQGFFNEQAGSGNNWEHDGTGTNTITESPVTDIFEDYAGGDYRIKASSSAGLAGAGAFINSAPPATIITGDIDFTISAPSFSATGSSTLPAPSGDIAFTIDAPTFNSSGSAALPQPTGSISFNINSPVFNASGGATLPNPSGTIDFTIGSPVFSSIGSATLPQPSGDVSFNILAPTFNGTGGASFPYPQGIIDFDIVSPIFSVTGVATQPNPTGNASFTIDNPVFTSTGSATLPQPSGAIDFTVSAPLFSATGEPSLPYPVGNVSFDVDAPSFNSTGSVTLPNPSGSITYTILAPQFSATGSVSGLVIPLGDVLTLTIASNVITLPYTSNTIKL